MIGIALTLLGIAAIVLGLAATLSREGLWIGVGAGAVFLGAAMLSPELVPPIASLVGRPLERLRGCPDTSPARTRSATRPHAATAAALMIGLALVSFVTVFAAGVRGSIDNAIDDVFASDLILAHTDGFSDIPLRAGESAAEVEGVEVVSPTATRRP